MAFYFLTATSDGDVAGSSSENDDAQNRLSKINGRNIKSKLNQSSPFGRRHFPRDSGCYEGSPVPQNQLVSNTAQPLESVDDANSLDSVVAQCSNEILKRVENARRMLQDEGPKGLSTSGRAGKKGLLGGSRNDDLCIRGSGGGCGGGGALSEKSSDSGVSSSSLSSGPLKNNL